MAAETLTWIGIALCVLQSGTFSGLNLAMFGIPALRLHIQASTGNEDAARLLELRQDSNFLLCTILWGNVGTNVLLTLLSDSVLTGVVAFVFSTFVITFGGEIIPQAYFSRNALRMATLMRPVLRLWQVLLFPIAKPTALILDAWLGAEKIDYISEAELRDAIKRHVISSESDIGRVEGVGAMNFLALDDVSVLDEGEPVDPASVIELPGGALPDFAASAEDPFVERVAASGRKWVVLTSAGEPKLVMDSDAFLRNALLGGASAAAPFCHEPIVVSDGATSLEDVLPLLRSQRRKPGDDVVHRDVVLVWSGQRRVITGADLLGRLLRGIARPEGGARQPEA